MQGPFLRKYGVETKIPFVLFEVDGVDFRVDAVDAGTDCSIMKDEGAEDTCTNDFVDEGKGYSLTLTATEMEAARIVVYVVDSATKVWLDDSIVVETYGHPSAMHAVDLDDSVRAGLTALPAAAADAAGGLPISDAGGLDIDTILGRITANVALASVCTEARLAELDAANLPANIDTLLKPIVLTGTAAAGSLTTITLTGGVATDGYYNGALVIITGGTGIGQSRTILSYVGGTTIATVTRDWAVAPDNTSVFIVIGADYPAILEAGTAQAGGASTITLDADASAINDTYISNLIMITAGTGIGQCRSIGAYNGGTKVATVTPAWTTIPDATSVYQMIPMSVVNVGGWLGVPVTLSANNKPDINVDSIDDVAIAGIATDGKLHVLNSAGAELALASICTEARLAELAAANLPADIDTLLTRITDAVALASVCTEARLAKLANLPEGIQKNQPFSNFEFVMIDSTTGDPLPGLTPAGQRSIDGAAFVGVGGAIAEVGNGVYQFDALAVDTNGDVITWRFTAAGADDRLITFKTSV